MAPSVTALLKIDFATRHYIKDSCVRRKDHSEGDVKPHLLRLVFVGRVLCMYLIEKFKIFYGKLLCADDHSEFKVVNECSLMLREKDPCEKQLVSEPVFLL